MRGLEASKLWTPRSIPSACMVNNQSLVHHNDAIRLCKTCKTWPKTLPEFKNTFVGVVAVCRHPAIVYQEL